MSKFVSILKVTGIVAGVVLAGFLLGWLGSRGPGAGPGQFSAGTAASVPATEESNRVSLASRREANQPVPSGLVAAPISAVNIGSTPTNPFPAWEDRVDEILTSTNAEADKAKAMLDIFPRLPQEGQVEVAQHLANLVPDSEYASLGKFLTNSALPEDVLGVLMGDILNRPNGLKLPWLLEVARDPQNPKANESKELLSLFLDGDYGSDWGTWQAKVEGWLKDNPD